MTNTVVLNTSGLTAAEVVAVARNNARIEISESAVSAMAATRVASPTFGRAEAIPPKSPRSRRARLRFQ